MIWTPGFWLANRKMIILGEQATNKSTIINEYCVSNEINKIFILSPKKYYFTAQLNNFEVIEYSDIIEYQYFYRLLQEIDSRTLIVINECMRTKNRYDLTYNCIRHFLNQTSHQIIFQWFPFIEDLDDFMILFDFDTRSRWKHKKFDCALLDEIIIQCSSRNIKFSPIEVKTDDQLQLKYQAEKKRLIDGIGIKDPHTIPRNLYLLSGKARLQHVDPIKSYIGRNNRFKIDSMQTYKEDDYHNKPYSIFEFPHNFIDFEDFSALSSQTEFDVLVSDLKVDAWYFNRYTHWTERLNEAYASLS